MSRLPAPPAFLWELFQDLRRRQFLLGPDDWTALWLALRAGFGLESRRALLELCVSLWATSQREAEVLRSRFPLMELADWDVAEPALAAPAAVGADAGDPGAVQDAPAAPPPPAVTEMPVDVVVGGSLPPLPSSGSLPGGRPFVFLPQFPVSEREVVQSWRRLRKPVRAGPATELDVSATIDRRTRSGVVSPPVLVPRRLNTSRLLILVDRQGSMAPYHRFVDEVCGAIDRAAGLNEVVIRYFHDVPAEGAPAELVRSPTGAFARTLDDVLPSIEPLADGLVFRDGACTEPASMAEALRELGPGGAALLVSDAGAARGSFDIVRLLDTVAFLKGLRQHVPVHAWLNPVPPHAWKGSTAAQLARHSPMFPLTVRGMHAAVDVLRGHPVTLERPA